MRSAFYISRKIHLESGFSAMPVRKEKKERGGHLRAHSNCVPNLSLSHAFFIGNLLVKIAWHIGLDRENKKKKKKYK